MALSRFREVRIWLVVVLVVAGALAVVRARPVQADVTAVKGSAFGYSASVTLFNSPQTRGPEPTVTLPSTGAASPVANSVASANVQFGPAIIFSSDRIDVSTTGSTGASGSVTSTTKMVNVNKSGQEVFTAAELASSCTASESGVSATTTIGNGRLQTSEGNPNIDGDETFVNLPANPAPNTVIEGKIEGVGDSFRYVFNEQVTNTDGSITVRAAHQYLLGPTATGDVILGEAVCGVTATAATTTTTAPGATTTTTAPGATTTTTAPGTTTTTGATTTTVATTTTTSAATTATGVAGGAYGFFASVALFGGSPGTRGPTPTVSLPAGGSASPITDSAATGEARFGPAILFTSDRLEVSTQGTPGGTVTSSAKANNVNRSGQEQLTASSVSSSCTASAGGETGSVTVAGGKLITSSGANAASDADDTVVQVPAEPAPNTSYEGKIEDVGDTFRVVFNEQQRGSGSITVNAVHVYLLGPTATGELIIGQSRCGTTTTTTGSGTATAQGGTVAGTGGRVAATGSPAAVLIAMGMLLASGGSTTMVFARGLRDRRRTGRPMPWERRGLLR